MDAFLPIRITPVQSPHRMFWPAQQGGGFFEHTLDHFLPHARNNYHPHIFSHRLTGLFSALLVALKVFTLAALTLGPIVPAFSSAITVENIITLTNQSRASFNLPSLSENQLLDQAAQAKANDMLAKGYFAHVTPDGKTPWDFIVAAGYNYITAGENLAVNFTQAENVETAWMNSPEHKANIVNSNYQDIGIGISEGQYQGHEAIFVVQMFGTLAEQKIALTDKPTTVQQQTVPAPAVKSPPVVPRFSVLSQTIPASATVPVVQNPSVASAPLTLDDPQIQVTGNTALVTVHASDAAVKILGTFGQQAVMFVPKADNLWLAQTDLSTLAQAGKSLIIKAYDLAGHSQSVQVADFAGSTPANYQLVPEIAGAHINFAGLTLNPKNLENHFYLIFIAAMLTSLVLALSVKRHVHHLSMITNGSFVIILATLLFMTG